MDSKTILIVDDESTVQNMIRRMLERQGDFNVLTAIGYFEAVERLAEHTGRLHLAIIDIALPDKNGFELAVTIQKQHPETKILYISGNVGAEMLRYSGIAVKDQQFLPKPFTSSEIFRKVEILLSDTEAKAQSSGSA